MRTKLCVEYSISQLADKLSAEVVGDGALIIRGIASSDELLPDHISFLRASDPRRLARMFPNTNVGAVLVAKSAYRTESPCDKTVIIVTDPLKSFVALVDLFFTRSSFHSGIHPTAIIDPTAKLGKEVIVGPYSIVGPHCEIGDSVTIYSHAALYGRCKIGAGSVIHAHVTIKEDVILGEECIVQAGAVIGSDGFGYFFDPAVGIRAVPQVGKVELADGVELGANCCIDRATLGVTKIGKNSKLDNLVQIGHNVQIGSNSLLCGQVGVGGSTVIGNGVTLGGQVGVVDHLVLADGVRIGAKSAAFSDLSDKGDYAGIPAIPASTWRRLQVLKKNLPKLFKTSGLSDS